MIVSTLEGGEVGKVLYIEDNPANLKLMENFFRKRGDLGLITAITAEEGLGLAREHIPDLILLDINLPGMDGYEILKAVRGDEALTKIPVCAVTANAMPDDRKKGQAAGFDEYLVKPLDLGKLSEILEKFLREDRFQGH